MMLAMNAAYLGFSFSSPLRSGALVLRAPAASMLINAGGGAEDGWKVPDLPMSYVGEDYVDPLATNRPKYDLCAASGRPDEVCCGAIAPATPFEIDDWTSHMRGERTDKGAGKLLPFNRALVLLTEDEAQLRSPDGTAAGYDEALRAAGFTVVTRIDLAAEGARAAVNLELQAAKAAKERVCIHCVDGTSMTSIVMCDWLLMDYIGGDNCEEASETLRARKRLGGVERFADAEIVANYIVAGQTGVVPVDDEDDGPSDEDITVSEGGILLL